MGDDGVAVRGLEVVDPIRNRPKHRDNVLVALHGRQHDGVRAHAARDAVADVKGDPGSRWQVDECPPNKRID
jgi:hypothetical protein